MICPYCGEPMQMYERLIDYEDGEIIQGAEHFCCNACMRTFSTDIIYAITARGDLEE